MKQPSEFLREAAATFDERNPQYGDNYIQIGSIMAGLFPNGLTITSSDDWNRMHIILLKIVKMSRYAHNFGKGGHADSAHDDVVYSAMLEAVDAMIAARRAEQNKPLSAEPCTAETPLSGEAWVDACKRCGTRVRYGCLKTAQSNLKTAQSKLFVNCTSCDHREMCAKEAHCDRSDNGYR